LAETLFKSKQSTDALFSTSPNASALHGKTKKIEIASFHLNCTYAVLAADKHAEHTKCHLITAKLNRI